MPQLRLVRGPAGRGGRLIATAGLPLALDAMGGDHAPAEIVAGARRATEELGVSVLLVGPPDRLGDVGDLTVLPASEVIAMDEDPARAVRTKKDSSLVRAAEAVRDGKAAAMVSAGNTGATMASALLRMGRLKGVGRPAIATPIPVPGSTPTVLLDAGANAECSAAMLVQFAQMGSVFSRIRYGIDEPRVGLLSIGEEAGKGTTLVKEAHALLSAGAGVDFIGNVEGRDIVSDGVDVVVTDGFTGNVALKTLEGGVRAVVDAVLAAFSSSAEAREAANVLLPALAPLAEQLDPDTTGGAMLLGVDGVCIISHGSSSARAVVNALAVARDMVEADVVESLRRAVGAPGSEPGSVGDTAVL
ncbi:MAG TPA: phosphate acyltransferase PlsX [Acidimicrobiales bacterium]|nr:phosphate acyltransferase PlsX [Acidimicrobiales bacterium]